MNTRTRTIESATPDRRNSVVVTLEEAGRQVLGPLDAADGRDLRASVAAFARALLGIPAAA